LDIPIFDIEESYRDGDSHDLLVNNCRLGADLAAAFSSTPDHGIDELPKHALALMRRHGFTTVGVSIKEAVYRAVFTIKNAKVQTMSALLRNSFDSSASQSQVTENDKSRPPKHQFEPLNLAQATDSATTSSKVYDRPWRLWVHEVQCEKLYKNTGERD
jgi:ribulose-5-phosphate 4-epimerase/fuculose-1-phosphate aldolase